MSVRDRAALAIARMDQTRREMAERRAMRDRNTRALLARTRKTMHDRVPGMLDAAKQASEVAQRREHAGGWATTNTDRDRAFIMGFGLDDENAAGGYRPPATAPQSTALAPGGDQNGPTPQPRPQPRPEPEPAPAAPAQPRRPRERPAPVEIEDEDDFSNQSSWLRNR